MTTTMLTTEVAFADPKLPPKPEDLLDVIGAEGISEVAKLNAWVDSNHRNVTREWQYSNAAGWYEIPSLRQRHLFYFIPKRGDFRLNIVLGDKAIASLANGPLARRVSTLLRTAQRYPEGTVFSFDRHTLKADVAIAMLRAKIAH